MILVIDNFDSFTFNLVQLIGRFTSDITVKRNNEITAQHAEKMKPSGIVISPGPGRPENAGITVELIRRCGPSIPTLGVCLGHQAIGVAFGGTVVHAPSLMHGRTSRIKHNKTSLFEQIDSPFEATRYHSLVVSKENLPDELEITAETDDGVIMGVRHRKFPIDGVQFHPESILTLQGEHILRNWLKERVGYEGIH
jgi:anthranilate synthase/aminodeoxychorismate synthase-like glutamine amidotransferase